jgi:drug/metabolite transporter (DMT)-like permease
MHLFLSQWLDGMLKNEAEHNGCTWQAARVSRRDLLTLIVLSALWGASFLFYRVAAPLFGPVVLAEGRTVVAFITLAPLLKQEHWAAIRKHWKPLVFLGLGNGAIPYSMIAYAELTLTAPVAAILNSSTIIFTAALSWMVLKETMSATRVLGLALGLVGVAVVVGLSGYSSTRVFWLAVGAMTIASLSYASASVHARRSLTGSLPLTLAAGQQLTSSIILAPLAIAKLPAAHWTIRGVLAMVALGTMSTALAYILYFRLIRSAGATNTSAVTLIVPVFGTLWSWVFRGESLTWGAGFGALIIAAGVTLVTGMRLPGRSRPAQAAP